MTLGRWVGPVPPPAHNPTNVCPHTPCRDTPPLIRTLGELDCPKDGVESTPPPIRFAGFPSTLGGGGCPHYPQEEGGSVELPDKKKKHKMQV